MNLRINNAWICSIKDDKVVPQFADMIIQKGIIEKIIPKNFSDYSFSKSFATEDIYDACGRVITIPNVNFHDHIYSRLAKGLPVNGSMENFHEILKNLWWKLDLALDLDIVEASAKMAALESIRNGVLYIFDHHASPSTTRNSLNTIADVLKKFNLRGAICFETSDRNGEVLKTEALAENLEFAKHSVTDEIKAMMGIHASFTVDDNTLESISEINSELNLGVHVHVCEDAVDNKISREKYGDDALTRLIKYNLIDEKSILAHGIHLSSKDYDTIRSLKSSLAFNPHSNLNNAVGLPEYSSLPQGLSILCGTDGMHANVASSFKQIFLQLRHQKISFENTFSRMESIYLSQINFTRKYFTDYPNLNEGDRADLIIWDYVPPTPFGSDNFFGHYIYGITERQVCSAVSQGKFLLKDYKLSWDEEHVWSEVSRQGRRLLESYKKFV